MFSSQLGRVARASSQLGACAAQRTASVTRSAAAPAICLPHRTHQRRPSSSKASCPPDDESAGAKAATPATKAPQPARSPSSRTPSSRQSKAKKSKEAVDAPATKANAQEHDKSFTNLPRVANTSNQSDITLASFFSLHRPLSPTKPFPTSAQQSAFDRIFEPSPTTSQPKHPADVVSTLSSAIESLDQASTAGKPEVDLHWQVIQESPSNTTNQVHHLDGGPRARTLEEIVSQLKPYRAPKAPEPWGPAQEQRRQRQTASKREAHLAESRDLDAIRESTPDRAFKTTIIVRESTAADGTKYYSAQSSPVEQIRESEEEAPQQQQQRQISIEEPQHGFSELNIRRPNMPFRERMRQRSWRFLENRGARMQEMEERRKVRIEEKESKDDMFAISVKRQRKLKMKKHKYKKLMKRTRNLRRRLDRT